MKDWLKNEKRWYRKDFWLIKWFRKDSCSRD